MLQLLLIAYSVQILKSCLAMRIFAQYQSLIFVLAKYEYDKIHKFSQFSDILCVFQEYYQFKKSSLILLKWQKINFE